jgi:hypothetical protein
MPFSLLDPGWVKNQDPNQGRTCRISESLETIFGLKILKFLDADPDGSGREKFGSGINIMDPATLVSLEIFHSKEKKLPFVSDNVILAKLHWHQCFGSGFNYSGSSIFG